MGSPDNPISGVFVLDKPLGVTSMQAVATVRRRAGRAKTGHAGTLDPLATGVLVLGIGKATKSLAALMGTPKRYHTTIDLSGVTAGHDLESEPEPVTIDQPPDEVAIATALEAFRGAFMQVPPAHSAVRVDGKRAYKGARKGAPPAIEPRPVVVHELDLLTYEWPRVELAIHCEKGFYVRSLARDLGAALGTGGYCTAIRRTAVGPFNLEEATSLDDVPEALAPDDLIALETALARLEA